MTTLTAVAADTASVQLILTPSASVSGGITRTDINGTAPVRLPAAAVFPRTDPLTVTDWEAALGVPVTYRAGGATATVTLTAPGPYLVPVLRPALSRAVEGVTEYRAERVSLGTVHQVSDRPDPLVALGRLSARAGVLTLWVPTHTEARAVENIIDLSGVLLLKQSENPGQDLYFVSLSTDLAPDKDADGWTLGIRYQEIARPTSPVTETAWTFGTVSRSFPSFRNVTTGYADFEGLSLNDQTGII